MLLFAVCLGALIGVEGHENHPECGKYAPLPPNGGELVSHKAFGGCPYPVGMTCTWELDSIADNPNSRLAFSFEVYELPLEAQPCARTYVKFHDPLETGTPVFKSLCEGRVIPPVFNSTSNKVKITFKTNDFGSKGFIMKIRKFEICRSSDFQCRNSECISMDYRCDGASGDAKDCADGSDEAGCPILTVCPTPEETMCDHKRKCYKSNQRCDGVHDCRDGSDEKGCTEQACDGGHFLCAHRLTCVPRISVCDGKSDCRDNSDEDGCAAQPCIAGNFRCLNKKCVSPVKVCNAKDDCGDNSDEFGCATSVTCTPEQFKCKIPRCVDSAVRCNLVDDCGDNSDEAGCPHTVPGGGPPCLLNHVFCPASKRCIKAAQACDGFADCDDRSDEQNCDAQEVCRTTWHQCTNSQYIAQSKKCDANADCADGSDESACPAG